MEYTARSEYIDIFFDAVSAGTFDLLMPDNTDVMFFDLLLSFGNIADVNDFESRRKDYLSIVPKFHDKAITDNIWWGSFARNNGIDRLRSSGSKIRIWASKRASDDLCGLYYLCSELTDNDLYLVDIPMNGDSRVNYNDVICYLSGNSDGTFNMIDPSEKEAEYYNDFHKGIIFNRINDDKKKEYADKWRKLVEENSDLRTYDRGVVTSYYYDDYYDVLLRMTGSKQFLKYSSAPEFLISLNASYDLNIWQIQATISDMADKGAFMVLGELEIDPGAPATDYYLIANKNYSTRN
ncbi:MAG: DUF1835 domain-containing protein [Erysipelotrichaceae bacterium]|nr:DUF1835 domain-containing protein [Erysipelotrichaceae bacterium]